MLTVALSLFGLFIASVIGILIIIATGVWAEYKNPSGKRSKKYIAALISIYSLVFLSNVGWWGGIIALVIWAVQTLAA